MNFETRLISKEDIKTCIDMPACLNITESVFTDHGQGKVVMPPKLHLDIPDKEGLADGHKTEKKAFPLLWQRYSSLTRKQGF